MTTPRDDRDLDRLLDKDGGDIGALYRRLARLEPPRRLDRAVLGEAARAVRGRPSRRHRWIVGLGSAAGLVLAAGVAWHVGQDALQRQTSESARHGMIVVPVEPITGMPRKHAPVEKRMEAPAAAPALVQPPVPRLDAARPAAQLKTPRPKPRPFAPPPSPPASAPTPAQTATPFPSATPSREKNAADSAAAAAKPSGASTQDRAGGMLEKAAPRSRAVAPAAPSTSIELRRDMQLAPDAWLAHIRQLLRQGRRQQAAESLSLFRRMHPAHALPSDLKGLLD